MQSHQGAHAPGAYFLHTSYEERGGIQHPGLGAWLMRMSGETKSTLPGNMRIGGSSNTPGRAGFLASRYNPLHLGNSGMGIPHSHAHYSVDRRKFRNGLSWLSCWIYRFTASILRKVWLPMQRSTSRLPRLWVARI